MIIGADEPYLWACFPLDRTELAGALEDMLRAMKAECGVALHELEVVISDDAGVEECNRAHLDCPGPTNILSFPLAEAASGAAKNSKQAGGCLMLSAAMLRRESLLYGQDPVEHAVRLLAHGLAHLAGFEHGNKMWELCARLETAGMESLLRLREKCLGRVRIGAAC